MFLFYNYFKNASNTRCSNVLHSRVKTSWLCTPPLPLRARAKSLITSRVLFFLAHKALLHTDRHMTFTVKTPAGDTLLCARVPLGFIFCVFLKPLPDPEDGQPVVELVEKSSQQPTCTEDVYNQINCSSNYYYYCIHGPHWQTQKRLYL